MENVMELKLDKKTMKLLGAIALGFLINANNVEAKSFEFRVCDTEYDMNHNCKSCKSHGKKTAFVVNANNGVVLQKSISGVVKDWSKRGKCNVVDVNNFSCVTKYRDRTTASKLNMFNGEFTILSYGITGKPDFMFCGY